MYTLHTNLRLNRTIIGLKESIVPCGWASLSCLNRTIIGLKDTSDVGLGGLDNRLNRTIIGLKYRNLEVGSPSVLLSLSS